MLKYFIHYGKQDKYQYDIEQVKGELKDRLKMLVQPKITEKEIIQDIFNNIKKKYIRNEAQLLGYCIDNDYIEIMRKYSYILIQAIKVLNIKKDEEEE